MATGMMTLGPSCSWRSDVNRASSWIPYESSDSEEKVNPRERGPIEVFPDPVVEPRALRRRGEADSLLFSISKKAKTDLPSVVLRSFSSAITAANDLAE